MRYSKLSKDFYINIYIDYLAYEIYLDKKFHKKENNSIEVIWNTCLDHWVLTDEEIKMMFNNAINIAKSKYKISI